LATVHPGKTSRSVVLEKDSIFFKVEEKNEQ